MNVRFLRIFLLIFWLVIGIVLFSLIFLASSDLIGRDSVTKFVWLYIFGSCIMSGFLAYLKRIDRK